MFDLDTALIRSDVTAYLRQHEHKDLLRLVVIGSVDDGKSTLIGRLLHDSHGIYEDQLAAVRRASSKGATRGANSRAELDLSLLTDGLRAEREQGITIDVAYRYFSTARRKFIIADTPGHVQYTRNMATGASTADVAVILIDARLGVQAQTRRHAYIAGLLGIPQLVACVNKMDLVNWDPAVFTRIAAEIRDFGERLAIAEIRCLPVSALRGDGIVHRSTTPTWYDGPTLLEHLESVPVVGVTNPNVLRFPVQYVIRPDLDYRGFAGQLASGSLTVGDDVVALPSGQRSRVVALDTYDGPLTTAFAPMSVTVRLADEIDLSRGDMLVPADVAQAPSIALDLDATLVWMAETALDLGRTYLVKHTTRTVRADIANLAGVVSPETLTPHPATSLALNDIGQVTLACHAPLFVDPYAVNRATGAFILIDGVTHDTVAAGMISRAIPRATARPVSLIHAEEREAHTGQPGAVVTVGGADPDDARARAYLVERALFDHGWLAVVVPSVAAPQIAAAAMIAIVADASAAAPLRIAPGTDARLLRVARSALSLEVTAADIGLD